MNSTLITYTLLGVIVYLAIYALLERVLKCVEYCALMKTYMKVLSEAGENENSLEDDGK